MVVDYRDLAEEYRAVVEDYRESAEETPTRSKKCQSGFRKNISCRGLRKNSREKTIKLKKTTKKGEKLPKMVENHQPDQRSPEIWSKNTKWSRIYHHSQRVIERSGNRREIIVTRTDGRQLSTIRPEYPADGHGSSGRVDQANDMAFLLHLLSEQCNTCRLANDAWLDKQYNLQAINKSFLWSFGGIREGQ